MSASRRGKRPIPAVLLLAELATATAALVATLSGCGWIAGLRRDVHDEAEDEVASRRPAGADVEYYKDPANRFMPPPPVNAGDSRTEILSGTPVDYSGERAKQIRVTAKNFASESAKNENSLWYEDGQNNYLFAQNRLKIPGDLVSIVIEDRLRKDMVDSVKRTFPPEYRDQDVRVPTLTKDAPPAGAPARAPAQDQGPPGQEPHPDDVITGEVLERYPNGNIRIRGVRRVPFKKAMRTVEVLAIVKVAEIDDRDHVKSSRFFEHKVETYR